MSSGTSGKVHLAKISLLYMWRISGCGIQEIRHEGKGETTLSRANIPHGIIASGVRDTRSIAIFDHVAVDILHEKIGREDAGHEIAPDVAIVEVILKE